MRPSGTRPMPIVSQLNSSLSLSLSAKIWDVNTGKPVQLTHQIKCATFTLSNNSNNLVMAGNQKYGRGISVGILDLNNSELTKEIKSDTNQSYGGSPASISLTPDERFAIVSCPLGPSSTNYVVFDLTTQQELVQPATITLDSDPNCSIVLNNEQVLTGTKTGQLVLWDIPSCQRIQTLNENGQNAHRDRITDLKLSPDRSCLVSTSADGTAKVWDATTKELISKLSGHKREVAPFLHPSHSYVIPCRSRARAYQPINWSPRVPRTRTFAYGACRQVNSPRPCPSA